MLECQVGSTIYVRKELIREIQPQRAPTSDIQLLLHIEYSVKCLPWYDSFNLYLPGETLRNRYRRYEA